MRTDTQPTISTSRPPSTTDNRPSRSWFGRGVGIAFVGLVAGLVLGITSYQNSQQKIDTFARVSLPGTVTVQVVEPGQQVVYYEGDEIVGIDDLVVSIADPAGATVAVAPFEGELIYETTDLTLGRAIATFDAAQIGAYEIEVSGIDTGQVTIGESFARLALTGVLAGLAVAGLSLVAGFVLWLYSILRRRLVGA
jgi:hypothetical protein